MADDMARAADSQTELDMKELCGKFSMETIATCAFGVNAETFSNSDSQFVQNAKAIFRSRADLLTLIEGSDFGFIFGAANVTSTMHRR